MCGSYFVTCSYEFYSYYNQIYKIKFPRHKKIKIRDSKDEIKIFLKNGGIFTEKELNNPTFSKLFDDNFVLNNK